MTSKQKAVQIAKLLAKFAKSEMTHKEFIQSSAKTLSYQFSQALDEYIDEYWINHFNTKAEAKKFVKQNGTMIIIECLNVLYRLFQKT